jgi:outer membrane protein OmpA-like peptidoglycan-associated protein
MTTVLNRRLGASAIFFGASLLTIAACTTTAPNPNIAAAQSRLTSAYNDKETAERGQGDLANAKTALMTAQTDWSKGDKATSEHQLMLGQTYLDLAETRGAQAKLEQDNARLTAQSQTRGQMQEQMQGQMNAKDQMIAGQNNELASKDAQLADAQALLRDYKMTQNDLGSTMVLQDVSFETGKSVLLEGGVNRLAPLIKYLQLSPQTRVRIEGFTDSQGGVAYNRQLSLDRADAVKTLLTGAGIDASRITSIGSGLTKPIATNKTVAGRGSNRRVEITLLKQP